MKTIIQTLSLFLLAFAIITPTFAADKADKAKAKKKKPARVAIQVPKGIKLNEDQRAKLAALNKELGPKLAACRKEAAGIITADQKKAMGAAIKEARAAGKKGKEIREAAEAAAKITEDAIGIGGAAQNAGVRPENYDAIFCPDMNALVLAHALAEAGDKPLFTWCQEVVPKRLDEQSTRTLLAPMMNRWLTARDAPWREALAASRRVASVSDFITHRIKSRSCFQPAVNQLNEINQYLQNFCQYLKRRAYFLPFA